jgi:hypothetical protein
MRTSAIAETRWAIDICDGFNSSDRYNGFYKTSLAWTLLKTFLRWSFSLITPRTSVSAWYLYWFPLLLICYYMISSTICGKNFLVSSKKDIKDAASATRLIWKVFRLLLPTGSTASLIYVRMRKSPDFQDSVLTVHIYMHVDPWGNDTFLWKLILGLKFQRITIKS